MSGKFSSVLLSIFLFVVFTVPGPLFAEGNPDQKKTGFSSGMDQLSGDVADAFDEMERASGPAATDMTPEDEYYLGRAVAAEIIKVYKLYTEDPALTAYLNKICLAITVNSSKPTLFAGYHVEILDTDEICAFATPGGHIFVSRGFIACAPSEDCLAAVIAHEVAHIQLRHAVIIIQTERTVQELTAASERAASVAARTLTPEERSILFRESITVSVNTLFRNGYSRDQEFEADKTALSLLGKAGYDPAALGELLRILGVKLKSGNMSNTHPSPSQRITGMGTVRASVGRETLSARKARYEEALKKLR